MIKLSTKPKIQAKMLPSRKFVARQLFAASQKTILIFFIALFISACTVTEKKSPELAVSQDQEQSYIPENWTLNGRISVIREQENWYAKFTWIQDKHDFQLSFNGPLGETELQISQISQIVHLKTPGKEITGNNLEQLLYQETGWEFPIASLKYWSLGYPNPELSSQLKYNEQQQISDIFQDGWHIQYPKRMSVENHLESSILLPKKIIAKNQNIKIKLIHTRWHLGESSFNLNE